MNRKEIIKQAKSDQESILDIISGGRYSVTDINTKHTMYETQPNTWMVMDDSGERQLIETNISLDAIQVLQNYLCKKCLTTEGVINYETMVCDECKQSKEEKS